MKTVAKKSNVQIISEFVVEGKLRKVLETKSHLPDEAISLIEDIVLRDCEMRRKKEARRRK